MINHERAMLKLRMTPPMINHGTLCPLLIMGDTLLHPLGALK